jgi:SPP1 family predicted phage head-tail adaptor
MDRIYIRSGKLRRRVEVQSLTAASAANAYNETSATNWQTVAIRWAQIEPLAGREVWQAQQVQPDTTHRVTLRFMAGLSAKMRLLAKDPNAGATTEFPQGGRRIFNIQDVQNLDERDRTVQLSCKEVT